MNIEYSKKFLKCYDTAEKDIQLAFDDALEIFLEDATTKVLRNHLLDKLGKKYFGVWSIDITGDWRALYRKESHCIIFIEIGTHTQLYG